MITGAGRAAIIVADCKEPPRFPLNRPLSRSSRTYPRRSSVAARAGGDQCPHGGLSASAARQLADAARQIMKRGTPSEATTTLRPATRLARDWHGRTHHVLVLDDGFDYRGRRYRSLTAIARDITGAAWSGPRFFGLNGARTAREAGDAAA